MRTDQPSHVRELSKLAQYGLSGEFYAWGDRWELRLLLSHGRLAWGICDSTKNAFVRHLAREYGISERRFFRLVHACQKSGTRLAEELLASRLIDHNDLRRAIRHQLEETFRLLWTAPVRKTVFIAAGPFLHADPSKPWPLVVFVAEPDRLVLGEGGPTSCSDSMWVYLEKNSSIQLGWAVLESLRLLSTPTRESA